ncbi:MAG: hypothetical protein ACXITV_11160, partial [Luteibaculaceae bacterium]
DWVNYLEKKFNYPVSDTLMLQAVFKHTPLEHKRELYLTNINSNIPLKTIRTDWDLRSTWFSIKENPVNPNELIFSGRGFGHGVGLCQEGAMSMSEKNFDFIEILKHYFTDIHLIDLSVLGNLR